MLLLFHSRQQLIISLSIYDDYQTTSSKGLLKSDRVVLLNPSLVWLSDKIMKIIVNWISMN